MVEVSEPNLTVSIAREPVTLPEPSVVSFERKGVTQSRYSQLSAKALPVFLYVDDFDGSNWVPSLYASEPLIGVHRSDDPLLLVCVVAWRGKRLGGGRGVGEH